MSNKWFSSFVVGLSATSLIACTQPQTEKKEEKKEEKKTEEKETSSVVVKGSVAKGTFKIGSSGHDISVAQQGKEVDEVVALYTQDIKLPTTIGAEFLNLPPGVTLKSYKDGEFTADGFRVETNTGADEEAQRKIFTDMRKKNLDALFVQVKNGIHNSSDAYKSIVEKKEFKDTNLIMVGEKAKSQSGSSSKVFAGGKVSTGTFNKYAAAYAAGFQAAVSSLNYSKEEKAFEETSTSFFIGSINDSTSKKKAFAFRRGVEAASSHPDYAAFLKVKFVSKTADSKTTGKRLYYDVNDWIDDDKIAEFTGSDDFTDADYKVMYIAGTTAEDWRGRAGRVGTGAVGASPTINWKSGDFKGLIWAMHKYGDLPASAGTKTGKTSNKTSLILDEVASNGYVTAAGDATAVSKHSTVQFIDTDSDNTYDAAEHGTYLERDGITLLGSIGNEWTGTKAYSAAAIKGLYLGGASYMLGKHTIFGAPLTIHNTSPYSRKASEYSLLPSNDTKALERMSKALDQVFSKELVESSLIASSPWLK